MCHFCSNDSLTGRRDCISRLLQHGRHSARKIPGSSGSLSRPSKECTVYSWWWTSLPWELACFIITQLENCMLQVRIHSIFELIVLVDMMAGLLIWLIKTPALMLSKTDHSMQTSKKHVTGADFWDEVVLLLAYNILVYKLPNLVAFFNFFRFSVIASHLHVYLLINNP